MTLPPATEPSTTVKVRRVSPATGANAAGTPSSRSDASTPVPVTPPASPSTSTSAPSACSVRATLSPLPPGRACTARGRFTPPQSTASSWWVTSSAGLRQTTTITEYRG